MGLLFFFCLLIQRFYYLLCSEVKGRFEMDSCPRNVALYPHSNISFKEKLISCITKAYIFTGEASMDNIWAKSKDLTKDLPPPNNSRFLVKYYLKEVCFVLSLCL